MDKERDWSADHPGKVRFDEFENRLRGRATRNRDLRARTNPVVFALGNRYAQALVCGFAELTVSDVLHKPDLSQCNRAVCPQAFTPDYRTSVRALRRFTPIDASNFTIRRCSSTSKQEVRLGLICINLESLG
jgi:hypothetical protein